MVFGTHASVHPNGDNAKQFATIVAWGMPPMQAIQAATATRESDDVDIDEFLSTIEVMTMWEDKITSEQRTEVQERGNALGAERVRAIEHGWLRAIEDLRVEMERGTDPMSDRVQALIARNRELTREFCGESAVVESVLYEAYREGAGAAFGLDDALRGYLARATY